MKGHGDYKKAASEVIDWIFTRFLTNITKNKRT